MQHGELRCWFRIASTTLSTGLLIVLASAGIVACGYTDSGQASTPSAQSPMQVNRLQTQVQKCGIVQGLGRLVPMGDARAEQVEQCFWKAFGQCRPAQLIFITSGVDMVLIRTFTIHNNNSTCSISDARQQCVVPNSPSAAGTYLRTGLINQPGALHFTDCGKDGDVFVRG